MHSISYGDLNLTLPKSLNDYDYDVVTQYGTITFPDSKIHAETVYAGNESYQTSSGKEKQIRIRADSVDVVVYENTAAN